MLSLRGLEPLKEVFGEGRVRTDLTKAMDDVTLRGDVHAFRNVAADHRDLLSLVHGSAYA